MNNGQGHGEIEKLKTGIPGFDLISLGGLPKGRTTLAAGTAGSAKTVMAAQFLAEGIKAEGDSGVFVTFEEAPDDIRDNMRSLGWDIGMWESQDKWAFVDASYQEDEKRRRTIEILKFRGTIHQKGEYPMHWKCLWIIMN